MDRIQRIRSLKEKNKPKTIQGPQGESGPQGVQGVQGERGDTGKQGEKGPKGDVGPKGSVGPRGNVGPKGEKGDTGAVGIVWLGAWGTLIEYKVNDAVSHIGQSYICIKAHKSGISTEPGVAVNWDKYWDIIAERGKKGPSGSQGPAGSGGSGEATPDATSTVKGKLQLANDLGGTADAPTTPTAVHQTGNETVAGNKTFTGLTTLADFISNALSADAFAITGMSDFITLLANNALTLQGSDVSISASGTLSIVGFLPTTALGITDNDSLGILSGGALSGGEVIYGEQCDLYFLDPGASNKTVYLNYDNCANGFTIIRNVSSTRTITVSTDPAAAVYTMASSVVIAANSAAQFGMRGSTGTIYKVN